MTNTETQPRMIGMDAGRTLHLGTRATIASFWPVEQTVTRRFRTLTTGGYNTEYVIPACDREAKDPVLVIIGDALESVYLSDKKYGEIPVPGGAPAIARDIVRALRDESFGIGEGRKPAIWVCEADRPTPAECKYWLDHQKAFFNALVMAADDAFFNGKQQEISTLHRIAAEWLNLNPLKHEWLRPQQKGEAKPCPFCRSQIDAAALTCPICREVVDQQRYNELKGQNAKTAKFLAETAPELVLPPEIPSVLKPPPVKPNLSMR